MSNQIVVRRSTRETVVLLGSSEAFTKRIIIWTLLPALTIAGLYDSNRFGTSMIGWILVTLVAHVLTTAVICESLYFPSNTRLQSPLSRFLYF